MTRPAKKLTCYQRGVIVLRQSREEKARLGAFADGEARERWNDYQADAAAREAYDEWHDANIGAHRTLTQKEIAMRHGIKKPVRISEVIIAVLKILGIVLAWALGIGWIGFCVLALISLLSTPFAIPVFIVN